MKHNKNHDNAPNAGPQLVPVHFEFTHPTALTVSVAGCFNHWQPGAKSLHPAGGGRWVKETVLPPGTYQYCLVVDGEWIPDPLASDYVPNPFGGRNSVLIVPAPETVPLAAAKNGALKSKARPKAPRAGTNPPKKWSGADRPVSRGLTRA